MKNKKKLKKSKFHLSNIKRDFESNKTCKNEQNVTSKPAGAAFSVWQQSR